MFALSLIAAVAAYLSATTAAPYGANPEVQLERRNSTNPYQPIPTACPASPLVRPATSINPSEAKFVSSRKKKADAALATWLAKRGDFNTASQPSLAFATSGGGLRAFLESAGVVKAFDSRDTDYGVSGLYQALTYQSGISGGSWFVSTLAGNNWPTISRLQKELFEPGFQNTFLFPGDDNSVKGSEVYPAVNADVQAKQSAGYTTTIVDPWGLLLAYQLIFQDGTAAYYVSDITGLSNFTSFDAPFPIITSVGAAVPEGQCFPVPTAPQYEFTPYEFGSWDSGVDAFTPIKYLGSNLTGGQPSDAGVCTTNYDFLGYAFGASSNIFPELCTLPAAVANSTSLTPILNVFEDIVHDTHPPLDSDDYALIPNPFRDYSRSTLVQNDSDLYLTDGGFSGQDVPIWPFIQPSRAVDVLLVNDLSEDTTDTFPNGTEVHQTYLEAQANNLTHMPFIPTPDVFVDQGLNKRATFFGCAEPNAALIVYLPNVAYTFPSNQSSLRIQYNASDTDAMIANGELIGTQNGDDQWPFCLACGIKARDGPKLPDGCDACLQKYCYYQPGTAPTSTSAASTAASTASPAISTAPASFAAAGTSTGSPAGHPTGPPAGHPTGPPAGHPTGPPFGHPTGPPGGRPLGSPSDGPPAVIPSGGPPSGDHHLGKYIS